MAKLNVEICPETGICSILKADGTKIDLMPDEADALRHAAGKPDAIKKVIAEVDEGFAGSLDTQEITELAAKLK